MAALGEDGSLTPVDEIYRYRMNVAMIDMDTTIPVRAHTENGTIYSTTRDEGVYGKAGASVDVRALASTVYYYVYNTPNGNTVVREYVGYANIPDLGKDADKVEDVYVVGTRAEDARDDEYYTAEIVVVELEDGYTEIDSEQVFIYDLPVVGTSVKYEEVSVIRADGTTATVTIDLDKSNFREYDPAWGKAALPGLYYMWESDVKDVYVIDEMSWNDIAANRYVVGTVLKDTATGADDWTSFTPYYNNTNYITDLSGFVIFDDNGEVEKRNTEDTKYYELDYSENKYGDYVGDLTEGDREDVLPQRKDGGENEVLVKYNSDNEIVYAISFAQWENEKKGIVDFAQDVWAWNTPAAKEIVVSDYEKAMTMADEALYTMDVDDLTAALDALQALDPDDLTGTQLNKVNAKIAEIEAILNPVSGLYSVEVKGVEAELTGGKGTEADPFTYVADADLDGAGDWLKVVANDRDAVVNIHYGSFASDVKFSDVGEAIDNTTGPIPADAKWYVEVEGMFYTVAAYDSTTAITAVGEYSDKWNTFTSGDYYVARMDFDNTVINPDDIGTVAFTLKDPTTSEVVATVTYTEEQVNAFVESYGIYWPTSGNTNTWEIYVPGYLVAEYLLQTEIVTETETITRPIDFQPSLYPDLDVSVVVTMDNGTVYSLAE